MQSIYLLKLQATEEDILELKAGATGVFTHFSKHYPQGKDKSKKKKRVKLKQKQTSTY